MSPQAYGTTRDGRHGKKVEPFSPTLAPIDSEGPPSPSHNGVSWDTETDHILSYFLGGDPAQHLSVLPDFAASMGGPEHSVEDFAKESGDEKEGDSVMEENEGLPPPPTPVTQFYSHGSSAREQSSDRKSRQRSIPKTYPPSTQSNSSSSLSSMTAALVSGGPLVNQSLQSNPQQTRSDGTSFDIASSSPISPASLIGPGIENLMLPPPTRQGSNTSVPQHPVLGPEGQAQHLAWLRDLNAMARANHQQQQHQTQANPQMHGMMTGHTAPPMIMPPNMYAQLPSWALTHTSPGRPPKTEKESEEKRALRLQRNRESARKSRRRKKDRLTTLEKQVSKMQDKIAHERQVQINAMVAGLTESRVQGITKLQIDQNGLLFIVRNTGPYSQIAQAVLEFQYTLLKQLLLPRYQSMWHWFALQEEAFFTIGKEEYMKGDATKQAIKTPAARISSKQIGEEMSSPKEDQNIGPDLPIRGEESADQPQPQRTAYANDAPRMWPLFCYEMSFSVDQEEKLTTAQKKCNSMEGLVASRTEAAAAVRAAASLRVAVESLCHIVSRREEKTVAAVLCPVQASRYQKWLEENRSRCHDKLISRKATMKDSSSIPDGREASLEHICQRLNEVLQISNRDRN
uniref:BZIP transcription factor n=1 Tax=Phaeodactylum tricornutum TaxID=2850 RepID=F8WL65_PHATR|nr:bZIP transcription factor [Phaeodactylum tricornutum]